MRELTLNENDTVTGGKRLTEGQVIREEGWLWDTCYSKKPNGSKGSKVTCPKKTT